MEAALASEPEAACPYDDKRKADGRLTFSRAFRNAWLQGHREATRDREQALITVLHRRGARRPKPVT